MLCWSLYIISICCQLTCEGSVVVSSGAGESSAALRRCWRQWRGTCAESTAGKVNKKPSQDCLLPYETFFTPKAKLCSHRLVILQSWARDNCFASRQRENVIEQNKTF